MPASKHVAVRPKCFNELVDSGAEEAQEEVDRGQSDGDSEDTRLDHRSPSQEPYAVFHGKCGRLTCFGGGPPGRAFDRSTSFKGTYAINSMTQNTVREIITRTAGGNTIGTASSDTRRTRGASFHHPRLPSSFASAPHRTAAHMIHRRRNGTS